MRPAFASGSRTPVAVSGSLLARLVDHLVAIDARYRDAHKLMEQPEERLRDMGLTRPEQFLRPTSLRNDWHR